MADYLAYGRQWINNDDIQAVALALNDDWITCGKRVEEFEKKLADYCNARYAVVVSSGTAALHSACYAAGVTKGVDVIVPVMTFFASVSSIMMCGARPILVDIWQDTLGISTLEMKKRITKNTRVVMPVDFMGYPVELDEINNFARDNNLLVIEDACHALGAVYKDRRVGNISDMTVFSFHPVKHITTGEGGAVLTSNEEIYKRLLRFRNHNIEHGEMPWQYEIGEVGYNYRLTDIQCALGISQLKRLNQFIERRRKIADMYNDAFAGETSLITPVEKQNIKSSYHLYIIQLIGKDRDVFLQYMRNKGIGVQIHYIPAHYHSVMRKYGYEKGDFPVAEAFYECAISLPMYPKMSDEDVYRVVKVVKDGIK